MNLFVKDDTRGAGERCKEIGNRKKDRGPRAEVRGQDHK